MCVKKKNDTIRAEICRVNLSNLFNLFYFYLFWQGGDLHNSVQLPFFHERKTLAMDEAVF